MPFTRIGSCSLSTVAPGTFRVTPHALAEVGDVLVGQVALRAGSSTNLTASGWSTIGPVRTAGTTMVAHALWRVHDGSPYYTVSTTATFDTFWFVPQVYRATVTGILNGATNADTTSPYVPPSFSTPAAPATVLVMGVRSGGYTLPTTDAGFSVVTAGNYTVLPVGFVVMSKDVADPGSVTMPQWTTGANWCFAVAAWRNDPEAVGGWTLGLKLGGAAGWHTT